MPACQVARAHVATARRVITPVLEKRRQQKKTDPTAKFDDAMEWFETESYDPKTGKRAEYDPAVAQLVMSMAAIHTTTDLVCQVLIDIHRHGRDLLPEIRDEIVSCLREGGWKKTSLYNMKLLDSVIKETQRVKPIGIVSMRRRAMETLTLSDGTVIPKGSSIAVSSHRMWSEEVHEDPDKWDGKRFLRMREQPGRENFAQLVSTSPDHLGFGHGQHACPGRFFAANETKIALVFLLLQREWEVPEGYTPKVREFGFSLGVDPDMEIMYRARKSEIELDV